MSKPPSTAHFYRAFEDRYRGARDVIAARLHVYRPFLLALAEAGGAAPRALDLGCGRGEWLELLSECGLAGRGVDLDEGMLHACRARGLDVANADALASLRALPDASLALVSAFHLVEHLPFAMVQELVAEAWRVLRPGGLLILETPNPENLSVGACSFYLDPSHERPLPPALLDFAVEFGQFSRRRVLRLQEEAALREGPVALLGVLEGASPDYAVVAQKDAPAAVLARFDAPFVADYGVTLAALANRYEVQRQQRHTELHLLLQGHATELGALHAAHAAVADDLRGQHALNAQVNARLQADAAQLDARLRAEAAQLDARLQAGAAQLDAQLRAEAAQLDARLQAEAAQVAAQLATHDAAQHAQAAALQQLQAQQADQAARLAQLEARGTQLEQRIVDLLNSSSWRVTAPLRAVSDVLRRGTSAVRQGRLISGLRRRAKAGLMTLVRAVLRRPRLKRALRGPLARLPGLQARLQRMAYQMPAPATPAAPPSDQQLSPRAQLALQQLQRALAARKQP